MIMKRSRQSLRSGVTLVEMLVGVAVLGIIVAAAIPSLSSMMERRRVVAVAGEIASFFAQARAETLVLANTVTMHLEPVPSTLSQSCIRLTAENGIDTCSCSTAACGIGSAKVLREFLLPHSSSVRFEAVGEWGPVFPYRVPFQRGNYRSDVNNVKITVTGMKTGAALRVEYINTGRVRICSPDGSWKGYAPCDA